MQGESLLSLIKKKKSQWRNYALSEAPFVDAKTIITKKWKYIHHFESKPLRPNLNDKYKKGKELYDLETGIVFQRSFPDGHTEVYELSTGALKQYRYPEDHEIDFESFDPDGNIIGLAQR